MKPLLYQILTIYFPAAISASASAYTIRYALLSGKRKVNIYFISLSTALGLFSLSLLMMLFIPNLLIVSLILLNLSIAILLPAKIMLTHEITGYKNKPVFITSLVVSACFLPVLFLNMIKPALTNHFLRYAVAFFLLVITLAFIYCSYQIIKFNWPTKIQKRLSFVALLLIYMLEILILVGYITNKYYPWFVWEFVPLILLAESTYSFNRSDLKIIIKSSMSWIIMPVLFIGPNFLIFRFLYKNFGLYPDWIFFLVILAIFYFNSIYLKFLYKQISIFFNRRKYQLRKIETIFSEESSRLTSLSNLIYQISEIYSRQLNLCNIQIFLQGDEINTFKTVSGERLTLSEQSITWLLDHDQFIDIIFKNSYVLNTKDSSEIIGILEKENTRYCIPIVHLKKLIAVIVADSRNYKLIFSHYEKNFLRHVNSAAAIAISNALMYSDLNKIKNNLQNIVNERTRELEKVNDELHKQMLTAKNAQETLLPDSLPENSHYKLISYFRPLMEVSGDYYFVTEISQTRLALVVADISGHGVPAALLTSMITYELKNQIKEYRSTADICQSINQNLSSTLIETGFYFTMFLAIIDFTTLEMEYTNCSHTETIILRASNGEFIHLSTDGFLIGPNPFANFESKTIKLEPHDRIYFYTDGITDTRNHKDEFWGEVNFLKKITDSSNLELQIQLDSIVSEITRFRNGKPLDDDQTMLITEITGSLHRPVAELTADALTHYKNKNYRLALLTLNDLDDSDLSGSFLYLKAKLLFRSGNTLEAKKYILKSLEKESDNPEYLYYFAIIEQKLGNNSTASELLQKLDKIAPGYKKSAWLKIN